MGNVAWFSFQNVRIAIAGVVANVYLVAKFSNLQREHTYYYQDNLRARPVEKLEVPEGQSYDQDLGLN